MAKWKFLDKLGQWWNDTIGKVVPRLQVRRWADQSIDAAPVEQWASDLANDRLTVSRWEANMRAEIKAEYVRQAASARGGISNLTKQEWSSMGAQLKEQYGYLNKFAKEIASGNLTEGEIARRSKMYINSAREAFERAQRRVIEEGGRLKEVHWVRNRGKESCEDCIDYENMGWRPMSPWPFKAKRGRGDALPGNARTRCLTSCSCHLSYR